LVAFTFSESQCAKFNPFCIFPDVRGVNVAAVPQACGGWAHSTRVRPPRARAREPANPGAVPDFLAERFIDQQGWPFDSAIDSAIANR
jgi:hypothetical protein